MIEVDSFSKYYEGVAAVSNLSFAVEPGEILGLVGPNGAGKTTTLRSIAGIILPTYGVISIGGVDLEDDPVSTKKRLAFIPDEPHLFNHLTVTEHLSFIARLYQVSDAEELTPDLLKELELDEKHDAFPDELSRGMKQKLAIACGLLHKPDVLIFDEPLTGLDPGAIRRMKETIKARASAGTAVILSSHLLHLVEELCTRILVIHKGKKVAMGSITEIISNQPELEGRGLEDVFLALTSS